MSSTSGSVSDFPGLLTALLTYVGTVGWTVEWNQNAKNNASPPVDTAWGSGTREVVLSSTGVSTTEDIIVGIREVKYPTGSLYGWNLNAYKTVPNQDLGWNSNQNESGLISYAATQESWHFHPFLNMADTTMAYWFTVTLDFIIVTVRVSSDYFTMVLGNCKRLVEPTLYPHPCIAAGSSTGNYNYQSANNGGPVRPYLYSTYGASLMAIGSYPNEEFWTAADFKMHPIQANTDVTNVAQTDNLEVLMLPCFLVADEQPLFELDGIYSCRRDSLQSEDVITDGGDTYIVFQQGSSLANYNYLAIKQV